MSHRPYIRTRSGMLATLLNVALLFALNLVSLGEFGAMRGAVEDEAQCGTSLKAGDTLAEFDGAAGSGDDPVALTAAPLLLSPSLPVTPARLAPANPHLTPAAQLPAARAPPQVG